MQRRIFVAGNWKMNTNRKTACSLANGVIEKLADAIGDAVDTVEVGFCPPFVYLNDVAELLGKVQKHRVRLGAQDVYGEGNGAYTGEISTAMLKDVGVQFVLCGHSERRHVIGEADELINAKVKKVLADGLGAVLCVGETLREREAGQTTEVNRRQVTAGLADVSEEQVDRVVIAYEPVWAIGTGRTATPDQAQEVHAMIRGLVAELYGRKVADEMQIQYGGSVKPANAVELLNQPDIDGALVGGASLKVDDFLTIIAAAAKAADAKK